MSQYSDGYGDASIGDLAKTVITIDCDDDKNFYIEVKTPVRTELFPVSPFDTFSCISKKIDETIQLIYS